MLLTPRHLPTSLSSAEAFFVKKPRKRGKGGKKGKAEKGERRKKGKGGKNGKGGKSAREREKRRKPLPDFCRNMAKVVDIRPYPTAHSLSAGYASARQKPPDPGKRTSEVV